MLGLKKERALVGLDIGSHSVKAIEFRVRKKGKKHSYTVTKIGCEPLPHDAIVEGTIIDSAAVVERINALFEKNRIVNRDVVISTSGNSVIIKKISLPAMEAEELAESIIWEAKHNIPYPYEETHVDYAILKPLPGADDRTLKILLVAVKKDKIAAYSNVIHQADKNLEAIDVDAFALHNALEINYPEVFYEKTTAVVNIGASITTVVISERGVPQLFRDLSIGGSYFTENIRKLLNVTTEEAEEMLRGRPQKSGEPSELESVIRMNINGLLEEIEKTFAFYAAEDKREKRVEQIFLSGGMASLRTMGASFEQKFKAKTELFDPFRQIRYDEKRLDPAYYQEMAPLFAVATGLGTRLKEK